MMQAPNGFVLKKSRADEEVARRGVSVHVVSADESVEHVKLELKKATTYLSTMELRRAARGTAEEETSMHI